MSKPSGETRQRLLSADRLPVPFRAQRRFQVCGVAEGWGLDVGTKSQIYQLIGEAAAAGKAVLFVSSYLPELLGVCDRVCVMSRGQLGEPCPTSGVTEGDLLLQAMGGTAAGRSPVS